MGSGLQREYSFSADDNRLEETRSTRKGLQWDHRKVYGTPTFLTWQSSPSPSAYKSTTKLSFTQSSQSARTHPVWNRFPKIYREPSMMPLTPTFNSRNFI